MPKNTTTLAFTHPERPSIPAPSRLWTWLPWLHLALSVAIAVAIAVVVYTLWFPPPLHRMVGGLELFGWIVGVDVVCGPLLTWLLIKPHKTRRALAVDCTLIVCVQLGALIYGVYTLAHARPLAIVHEVDRFRVLSYSDVPETELGTAPAWFQPWGMQAPMLVGLRATKDLSEKMASLEAALQGVDAAQHTARWQEYGLSHAQVLARARPLAALRQHYPLDTNQIDAAVLEAGLTPEQALWLPVTSRRSNGWIALVEPSYGRIVGYLPLDGFF